MNHETDRRRSECSDFTVILNDESDPVTVLVIPKCRDLTPVTYTDYASMIDRYGQRLNGGYQVEILAAFAIALIKECYAQCSQTNFHPWVRYEDPFEFTTIIDVSSVP